jgi:hypothetical protein
MTELMSKRVSFPWWFQAIRALLVLVVAGALGSAILTAQHAINDVTRDRLRGHVEACEAARYLAPSLANLRAYQRTNDCPLEGLPSIPPLPVGRGATGRTGATGSTGSTGAVGPTGPALRTVTAPAPPRVTVTAVRTAPEQPRATTTVTRPRVTVTRTCLAACL